MQSKPFLPVEVVRDRLVTINPNLLSKTEFNKSISCSVKDSVASPKPLPLFF